MEAWGKQRVHLSVGLLLHNRGSCKDWRRHPAPDVPVRVWPRQGSWRSSLPKYPAAIPAPCKEPGLVSIEPCPALKQGQSLLASPIFSSWDRGLLFPFPYQSGKATWEPSVLISLLHNCRQGRGLNVTCQSSPACSPELSHQPVG